MPGGEWLVCARMCQWCVNGEPLAAGLPVVSMDPQLQRLFKKPPPWDFLGGAVVKNLPANAGDTGSSPGPGRSHMLRSN